MSTGVGVRPIGGFARAGRRALGVGLSDPPEPAPGGPLTVTWTEPTTTANGLPLTTLVGTWVETNPGGVWTPVGGTVGDPTSSPSWRPAASPSGGGVQSYGPFTPPPGATASRVGAIDVPGNLVYSAEVPL